MIDRIVVKVTLGNKDAFQIHSLSWHGCYGYNGQLDVNSINASIYAMVTILHTFIVGMVINGIS